MTPPTLNKLEQCGGSFCNNAMADRLTQLQDAVNYQAENLCNSIGVLQQTAQSTKFTVDKNSSTGAPLIPVAIDEYSTMFGVMIARCAKDIDYLIESLPSEESSTELQLASLRRLEQENLDAIHKLSEVIHRGECLLERIQNALTDISQAQIEMEKLENDPSSSNRLTGQKVVYLFQPL